MLVSLRVTNSRRFVFINFTSATNSSHVKHMNEKYPSDWNSFLIWTDYDCNLPLINDQTKITATSSMPGRGPENARLQGTSSCQFLTELILIKQNALLRSWELSSAVSLSFLIAIDVCSVFAPIFKPFLLFSGLPQLGKKWEKLWKNEQARWNSLGVWHFKVETKQVRVDSGLGMPTRWRKTTY